ncbi:diguanylate cyclase domain-containing protein [uncultured Clostridium sp.]|uniref:diguanylate cyclase domain-containing protein n=1 Tax=uncultured Clostridium sp. TaxID=59620 RepID=UPI0028EA83DF|nr:diguanylate cyclase [uncultured Clostridium sp.]
MIWVLGEDVQTDAVTDLPNFFQFILADTKKLFGDNGSIVILEIESFTMINKKFGREIGDCCLKELSNIIKATLGNNHFVYRTDGDEFTIVLPNMSNSEAAEISYLIKSNFIDYMSTYKISNLDLSVLLLNYTESICSINEIYHMILAKYMDIIKSSENRDTTQIKWIKHLIDSFSRRIIESLNLAFTDDITGLANHRSAKSYLANLIKESECTGEIFSILFIDGDNLKRYNKISYQHGNEMIYKLSRIIVDALGSQHKVFRWLTGDEFLVILRGVDRINISKYAEKIRFEVEHQTRGWIYPITVSIGISSYPYHGDNIKDIVGKAEKANLTAKNLGKNTVVEWKVENINLNL